MEHKTQFDDITNRFNIDAIRLLILDETGKSPGVDTKERQEKSVHRYSVQGSNFDNDLSRATNQRCGWVFLSIIYDACRVHRSLRFLNILSDASVYVHAISAHTSGATKPLDIAEY